MAWMPDRTVLLPIFLAAAVITAPAVRAHGDPSSGAKEQALGIRVETLIKSTQAWDGQRLPAYPRSQPEIQILRITIPAGVKLPRHTHPVINGAVISKGRLEVQLPSGGKRQFGAGDVLVEVVNTKHTGRALPGEDVEVLVFYAGTPGQPITLLTP